MRKNENGFTLIEMLIVLFVIGVILAIALPNLTKTGDSAKAKADEANIQVLLAQAENYRLVEGEYPESVDDLVGDYIQAKPECADKGKEFTFETSGDSITITCQ